MTSSDYRVTLQFSTSDPDQQEVIKLLKEKGRKKSIFITKAVKFYLENEQKTTNSISREEIKELIKEVLSEMEISPAQNTPVSDDKIIPKKENNSNEKEKIQEPTPEETPTEEDVDDFLAGLSAWGQENY